MPCPPQRLRAQAKGHQPFFSALETDLGKAKDVNERMVKSHSERDVDLERYRERVQQLLERWQAVLAQTDLRQRELDQLGRQLRYYRESCDGLLQWIQDAKQRQEQIQAVPITDSKTVREQLLQEKVATAARCGWALGSHQLHCQWPRAHPSTSLPRNCWRSAIATRRRWRSASAMPSSTSMPSRCLGCWGRCGAGPVALKGPRSWQGH